LSVDPRPRFVVLGASNVTLGFATLVECVVASHAGPLEFLAAHGHGRSYGMASRYLSIRGLDAIDTCGLWRDLERRRAPTQALLTDIGNDLVYGASVSAISAWIERALVRLRDAEARLVLTGLPLASLVGLGRLRFGLVRSLFFPGRDVSLERLLDDTRELDARLAGLARAHGATFVRPAPDWFGVDAIHVRRTRRREAWKAQVAPLLGAAAPPALSPQERRLLRGLRPLECTWFGRRRHCAQPSVRFTDGTTFSAY